MDLKALARKLEVAFAANPATADARVFRMKRGSAGHVFPYVMSRGFTPILERQVDDMLLIEAALERANLTAEEHDALGLIAPMTPREARGHLRDVRDRRAERHARRAQRQTAPAPRTEPAA